MSATIAEFLLARIAEDEADHYCYHSSDFGYFPDERYGCVECGIMDDRKCRTQLECAAKRAIVTFWGPHETLGGKGSLEVLATVYRDHSDYRQEWAA